MFASRKTTNFSSEVLLDDQRSNGCYRWLRRSRVLEILSIPTCSSKDAMIMAGQIQKLWTQPEKINPIIKLSATILCSGDGFAPKIDASLEFKLWLSSAELCPDVRFCKQEVRQSITAAKLHLENHIPESSWRQSSCNHPSTRNMTAIHTCQHGVWQESASRQVIASQVRCDVLLCSAFHD